MRVLIADDHEMIRRGIRSLLSSRPNLDVCGEAVDCQDAIEKAKELKPDVIVMDISMPNVNGLEATRHIRDILPQIEVLILSQHNSPQMVQQGFTAGARGYVVKSSISRDLLMALDKVSRHESFCDPAITGPAIQNPDAQEIFQRSSALEQALRESEELYRSTFERAPVGIAHLSPHGGWLRVNQKFCALLGYTPAELLKMSYHDITHPDDLAADVAQWDKLLAGAADQYSMEKRYLHKDGSPVWVLRTVSAVRGSERKLNYFLSVIEDIAERKNAELLSAKLAAIVESSEDGIVSKSLNGIIDSWNAGAERIFGFTPAEAIGQPITIIIPPESRSEETDILRRIRNGQRIDHYETVRMTKAGKKIDVALTISPVKDASGTVIGASKIVRDISERKQFEVFTRQHEEQLRDQLEQHVRERTRELQEKNTELEKNADVVRELSARLLQSQDDERRRIARELHDSVGQMISAVGMNIAQVLKESSSLSPEAAKAVADNAGLVEQVSREIRTMSHLLHPPLLDEVGLRSALEWYIEGFAQRSKIKVQLELDKDFGRLSRDQEIAVFRIVQECLTNIHRHSGSATALVRLSRVGDQATLEVQDCGKGLTAAELRTLGEGQNVGVGFRGMRERLRQLGGRLDVRSDTLCTQVIATLPVS